MRYHPDVDCWAIQFQYGETVRQGSIRYSLVLTFREEDEKWVGKPLPLKDGDGDILCAGTWCSGDGFRYQRIEVIGRVPDNGDMRTFSPKRDLEA